ncbi:MAG: radical SAM protein [Myxococcales bacterium]|nr:radical SAM protein [Myxococcales bacterium]
MDPRTTARNLLEEGLLRQTPRASRVYHAPNLVVLERDGVSLAIAPSRPHWIATNARGAEVLRLLDGRTTVLEVANKLARERREPVEATLEEVAGFLDAAHAETFVTLRPDLSPPYRGRGEAVRPGRLSELYVFVTNDCNLRCTHCYVSSGDYVPPEELTTEELKRLIDDAKELGVSRFYFTGGEPFMRKDIFELIDYVCRDAELVILSNAMYFVGKNVERLRDVASRANAELRRLFFQVSLDGPTAELHEQVRGPNSFGKTIEGIKTLVALDLTPAVSTSINVDNQDHIAATTRLVASLGVKEHHILWLQERGRAYDNDQLLIAPSAVTRIMREPGAWPTRWASSSTTRRVIASGYAASATERPTFATAATRASTCSATARSTLACGSVARRRWRAARFVKGLSETSGSSPPFWKASAKTPCRSARDAATAT